MSSLTQAALSCAGAVLSGIHTQADVDPFSAMAPAEHLGHCGEAIAQLAEALALAVATTPTGGCDALRQKRCDDLLRVARAKLHAHPFAAVPANWRRLFTDASLVKAAIMVLRGGGEGGDDALAVLDMAIIMAGAPGPGADDAVRAKREALEALLEALDEHGTLCEEEEEEKKEEGEEEGLAFDRTVDAVEVRCPIDRRPELSLDGFQRHMDGANTPLIVTGALGHWPAMSTNPWKSSSYLLSLTHGGRRLVPVEVGRAYTDPGWGQKIVPFREFLETYMAPGSEEIGYLAQHTLFSQIPKLRNDFLIPDYCYSTPRDPPENVKAAGPLEEPLINAWLGPRGTVSPLHTDPYANVLAQVVGSKYLRLYPPDETARVFPRGVEAGGVDMANTSRVEVEEEGGGKELTEEESRVFGRARYVDCVLKEGELLFIPAGWWHYVRSLEASFSVSFWWN